MPAPGTFAKVTLAILWLAQADTLASTLVVQAWVAAPETVASPVRAILAWVFHLVKPAWFVQLITWYAVLPESAGTPPPSTDVAYPDAVST